MCIFVALICCAVHRLGYGQVAERGLETKREIAVAIIVAFTLVASILAMNTYSAMAKSSANSQGAISTSINIGVYSDSACTISEASMSWGSVAAGASATYTVYVKNTGTGTMALSLGTSNWNPASGNTYITVSWNQEGTKLSAGQSVAAIITLTVSPKVTGISSFDNTITIVGVRTHGQQPK